jgi:hypothetical protein
MKRRRKDELDEFRDLNDSFPLRRSGVIKN